MRMTVGPLPPAVYWRRRAAVLGALLLVVIVLLWSCTGNSDDPGKTPGATGSATATPVDEITPNPAESADAGDAGGPPLGDAADDPAATGTAAAPTNAPAGQPAATDVPAGQPGGQPGGPTAGAPGTGQCADAEILVTPVPVPAAARRGQPVELKLRIKNSSTRTCDRDVGADLQEIYIKLGAQTIWSSDRCGTARGSKVQPFTPGFEREFQVTWNGRDMTRCANGQASGPVPAAGEYQLFGRLGSQLSQPVKLVLTG